ncbi:MAG: hypothetical protein ACRDS9_07885 [Pseudonocardiaceae bacterium]
MHTASPRLTSEGSQVRTLLRPPVLQGRELLQLRDTAIIRLLLDSGGWLGEVATLGVDDIDFDMDVAHAVGKGRQRRWQLHVDKIKRLTGNDFVQARDLYAKRASVERQPAFMPILCCKYAPTILDGSPR